MTGFQTLGLPILKERELENKIALVTGATRGIGRAIALEFAQRGARVIGTATTRAGAETISESLAESGGRGVVLDVTDAQVCDQLIAELGQVDGGRHILVQHAGITRDHLARPLTNDEWEDVQAQHLTRV